jgi:hypothetical protein
VRGSPLVHKGRASLAGIGYGGVSTGSMDRPPVSRLTEIWTSQFPLKGNCESRVTSTGR